VWFQLCLRTRLVHQKIGYCHVSMHPLRSRCQMQKTDIFTALSIVRKSFGQYLPSRLVLSGADLPIIILDSEAFNLYFVCTLASWALGLWGQKSRFRTYPRRKKARRIQLHALEGFDPSEIGQPVATMFKPTSLLFERN